MKKIYLVLILIITAILTSSCIGGSTAEGATNQYFKALFEFDMSKMSEVIEPRQLIQFEDVIGTEFEENSMEAMVAGFVKEESEELTYTIKESAINEDYGALTLECTFIDWEKAYKRISKIVNDQVFLLLLSTESTISDKDMPKLLEAILYPNKEPGESLMEGKGDRAEGTEALKSDNEPLEFPTITEEVTVKVVMEGDKWYVKSMKPNNINASWLDLKDFTRDMEKAVSKMQLNPKE